MPRVVTADELADEYAEKKMAVLHFPADRKVLQKIVKSVWLDGFESVAKPAKYDRWRCFFRHVWGKWEIGTMQARYIKRSDLSVARDWEPMEVQFRHCERCGWRETRENI